MKIILPISLLTIVFTLAPLAAQPPELPDGTVDAKKTASRLQVPPGFTVDVWAAEPMLGNPVAFCIDEKGRVFTAESYRFNRGTEEYRTRPFFLEGDLSNTTTADRLSMFKKYADKFPGGMSYFSKYSDRVRLLEDTKGQGRADKATTFADGFNDPLDGLNAGVLARDGKVFVTCIPKLWQLEDTKKTGQADIKKALLDGFGPMSAFLGHDLHGLIFGPDGKLYFSVGDRGYHVTTKEGKVLSGPRNGAVFRCEPDGSQLEVIHTGLRNPQELAFDQYGNLFADDNNCDKGDDARLVYIVEGGHSGWNMAYQTIDSPQFTAPYMGGPWFAEKLWHQAHPGQAAYIVPPVGKIGAGPSGFAFSSGLGLPARYKNTFFMANFTGNGGIDAFRVQPKGAGFEVVDYHGFVKQYGLLTDVDFGYDGKMYISDWAHFQWDGGGNGKGRIYTVYDPKALADPAIQEMKDLFAKGFDTLSNDRLVELLHHADQRVRQRAQFTLAAGGVKNLPLFVQVAKKDKNQLARIHAIWGMGQIATKHPRDPEVFSPKTLTLIRSLLKEPDIEIRAQAAKLASQDPALVKDLDACLWMERSLRVRFFLVESLGKIGPVASARQVYSHLLRERELDPFLRHAYAQAITRIIAHDKNVTGNAHPEWTKRSMSTEVELVKVLVARAARDPGVARFFDDPDPSVVLEAARAVHDLPISSKFPDLAQLSQRYAETLAQPDDALWRRIINAHYRLGNRDNALALIQLTFNPNIKPYLREEMVRCLMNWALPAPRDRVTGFWRPLPTRDVTFIPAIFRDHYEPLLLASSGSLLTTVLEALTKLDIPVEEDLFVTIAHRASFDVDQRIGAINLLAHRKSKHLPKAIDDALAAGPPRLKMAARDLLSVQDPVRGRKELEATLENGEIVEKQAAYRTLAKLKAVPPLQVAIEQLVAGKLAPEVQLDVLVSAQKTKDPALAKLADDYKKTFPKDDPLAPYRIALAGGDASRGRAIFWSHTIAQCVRCHKAKSQAGDLSGGEAGPNLSEWALKGDRLHFLESLILPDKKITPGFGAVTLALDDGRSLTGILKRDDKTFVHLITQDGKVHEFDPKQIESRSQAKSQMPPMGPVLSLEELRDVIEFLDELRKAGAAK